MARTYAVASDLSQIVPTDDGFGRFVTEIQAVKHWIALLESENEQTKARLAKARSRRTVLTKRQGTPDGA